MVKSTAPTRVTPSPPIGPSAGLMRETVRLLKFVAQILPVAVYSDAGWTTADRDRADVNAVALHVSDGIRVERMRDPDVVVAIDNAALRKRRTLVERGE